MGLDTQRFVWAEADRYGVEREHDALPASVRWRFGDARDDRALQLGAEQIGERERAVAAVLAAARRHDPERPPDAQGLEHLDVPADGWLAAAVPRRGAAAVLGLGLRVGEAGKRQHARVPALDLGGGPPRPGPPRGRGARLAHAAGHRRAHEAIAADIAGEILLGDAVRAVEHHEGPVHFAGAHTVPRWPSFMDGAVESGHRVAEEVDPGMT